ncbi:unnamed protein product [Lactuca virosa]|uniref:Uncharacterized protein n=1 Tax=Lactuca virosa TaxID=75947 RepID=A0AAU9PPH8_9ASTR|nr:unnamed protein product [Lactuca virosa]
MGKVGVLTSRTKWINEEINITAGGMKITVGVVEYTDDWSPCTPLPFDKEVEKNLEEGEIRSKFMEVNRSSKDHVPNDNSDIVDMVVGISKVAGNGSMTASSNRSLVVVVLSSRAMELSVDVPSPQCKKSIEIPKNLETVDVVTTSIFS